MREQAKEQEKEKEKEKEYQNQIKTLDTTLRNLTVENATLSANFKNNQINTENITKENEQLKNKVKELEAFISSKDSQINHLMSQKSLQVSSSGYQFMSQCLQDGRAFFTYNNQQYFFNSNRTPTPRGIWLIVIQNQNLLSYQIFDTHGSETGSQQLYFSLSQASSLTGRVVIALGVIDEATYMLNQNCRTLFRQLGSSHVLGYRDSWILISKRNGGAFEKIIEEHNSDYSQHKSGKTLWCSVMVE